MKKNRTIYTAVGVGSFLLFCSVFTPFLSSSKFQRRGVVNTVYAGSLMNINVGDSKEKVRLILGPPLKEVNGTPGEFGYFFYSRTVSWSFHQPKVWIVFVDDVVFEVRVQEMSFWGDDFSREYYNKDKNGIRTSQDFEQYFRRLP